MSYFIRELNSDKFLGPYSIDEISSQLQRRTISDTHEAHEASGQTYNALRRSGAWVPVSRIFSDQAALNADLFNVDKQTATAIPLFTLPPVKKSGVATALTVIAGLELVGAPISGLVVGSDNVLVGWVVFGSGIISGLIFLGFARVIQNTFESSQRLKRLELLLERGYENKNAA